MQKPKIIVIGSTNTDLVIKTSRLPKPGETVTGGEFYIATGGKGANQAVAAARAGADVTFVGCIADDDFGKNAVKTLKREGINVDHVKIQAGVHSGMAFIFVDEQGQNLISVASGANDKMLPEDIRDIRHEIESAKFLLLQLEIPLSTVKTCIDLAYKSGTQILLNPAPAQKIPDNVLAKVNYITPNEHELAIIADKQITTAHDEIDAANRLLQIGVDHVIVTKGENGIVLVNHEKITSFSALKVNAIDTVGAGDCFSGCLAVALSEGQPLAQAIDFAQRAAAITVTRKGAQPSFPYWEEIKAFFMV